jgi:hypothetical protein
MSDFKSKLEGRATASQQINSLGAVLHIIRSPSENMLADIYLRLNHEGQLAITWHVKVPTLSEFLADAKRTDQIYYVCLAELIETREVTIAGIGWFTDVVQLTPGRFRGSSGMVFLQQFQTRKFTMEFCEMMIDDGFMNCSIDVQYGYSPVPNRPACMFHRAMGFEVLAVAPSYSTWEGKPCDIQISVMTRERWDRRGAVAATELTEVSH